MRKKVHINFHLDPVIDKDIIEFMKKQENQSRLFRKLIRVLIKKHGNIDMYKILGDRGDII